MEEDQDAAFKVIIVRSTIGELIVIINKMALKPEVDNKLGQTLDIFMDKLNVDQQYLANGIFNVRFAEAGLFLQSAVELYGKKVDKLWDNTLQYQMQLCSYKQDDLTNELTKLAERMLKKGKRKSLLNKDTNTSNSDDFLGQLHKKSEKCLDVSSNLEYCKPLKDAWDAIYNQDENDESTHAEAIGDAVYRNSSKRVSEMMEKIPLVCSYTIFDSHTKEKLCNYDELLTNHVLIVDDLYHSSISISDDDVKYNDESLQVDDVLLSDNEVRSSCLSKPAVVNVTRLPQNLMDSFEESNESLVRALIHRLIVDSATQNCEGTTSIQTLLQNEDLNFSDDQGYNSAPASQLCSDTQSCSIRRSNDDSGIFCSQLSNTIMEVDETDHDACDGIASNVIPEIDENAEQSIMEPEHVVPPTLEVPSSQAETSQKPGCLNFSGMFVPMVSSTPKSVMPVVKVERLTRKRVLQFDVKSILNQPKPSKRATLGKWLKTTVSSERKFEKFHSANYVPGLGEGIVEPWMGDDTSEEGSDDDNNEPELEEEPAEQEDVANVDFCRSIVMGIVDNLGDDVELPAIDAQNTTSCANEPLNTFEEINSTEPIPSIQQQRISATVQNMRAMHDWREFIEPIINEAESRSKFNIHEYGTTLMDAIPDDKNLSFKDAVSGKPAGEVVRYFLASLQLANTYNVELVNTCPGKLANDYLEMKLLTRERYHEHLDEYEAPSENTIREKMAKVQAIQSRQSTLSHPSTSRMQTLPEPSQPFTSQSSRQYNRQRYRGKRLKLV